MENKLDIKETLEIIVAMGTGAVIIKKIAKDGITASDLMHLKAVADSFPVMKDAVDGAGIALEELKDLDQTEVLSIVGELYKQATLFNEA